jgi:hypothetical protein
MIEPLPVSLPITSMKLPAFNSTLDPTPGCAVVVPAAVKVVTAAGRFTSMPSGITFCAPNTICAPSMTVSFAPAPAVLLLGAADAHVHAAQLGHAVNVTRRTDLDVRAGLDVHSIFR